MNIKQISLENFRNYGKKVFEFSPGLTLIVGPNTSGKSNLLEAVFLLAHGVSPRAELDREMVREGTDLSFVRGTMEASDPRELEVALTSTGKRFRVNGVGKLRRDFTPQFHVVLFSPEDLNLVTGNPDLRRRFLDFALSSVDAGYARASSEYEKVRKNRNRLLERINQREAKEEELGFWDAKLLEHGVLLQDKRKEFFNEISSQLATSNLQLDYLPSGLTAERLLEFRPREIAAETSLVGPHRDDFSFLKSELMNRSNPEPIDLSAYGSRGEQRRAVFALKKAELEFVQKRIGSRPVLLLDDIFSELDEENRARVFDLIGEGQAILTTTDLHHIPPEIKKELEVIQL